jgi:hypothetical protein
MTAADDESAGPVKVWLEEIAQTARQPLDVVQQVLKEYGVRPQTALPRPHRILVTKVEFGGLRPGMGERGGPDADEVPFHFEWKLGPGVWCLASSGMNEAGKSSVLEVILWCLRGRSGLQRDVQSWLRRAHLEFSLDDDLLVVDITVLDGRPTGTVRDKKTSKTLISFASATSFEESMDAFMMDRLGLEPLRTQQRRPDAVDGPPLTGELSWPAYSSGLHISRSGLGHLLGNEARNALPTRLLELFLGAPWASTMVAASVGQKIVAARLSAAKQQAQADAAERQRKLDELDISLHGARARLAALPDEGQAASGLAGSYLVVAEATREASAAQQHLATARTRHDQLEGERQALAAAVHAAQEAVLARAFFHTLKPTVCPRCDARVSREQWAREREGACSLCTSELPIANAEHMEHAEDEQDVNDDEELRETLTQVQRAVEQAAAVLADRQHRARQTSDDLARAQAALDEAFARPVSSDRRDAELEVARLEGALLERRGRFSEMGDPAGIAPLERDNAVLKAAEKASRERRTQALRGVLGAVEQDIVAMGRQLGLEMLEAVELGTSATLKVRKGGQEQPYGSLTEGEQLRLKIVTTAALLRHGIRTGVGRHPGLLIIDSPGAEEVDSGDLRQMLEDLVQLSEIAPDLQVIIATARGQEVASIIRPEQLRLAPEGQRLW